MTSEKQGKKKGKMSWYLMHLLLLVVTGSLLGASKSQSFIGPFSLCFVIGQTIHTTLSTSQMQNKNKYKSSIRKSPFPLLEVGYCFF